MLPYIQTIKFSTLGHLPAFQVDVHQANYMQSFGMGHIGLFEHKHLQKSKYK